MKTASTPGHATDGVEIVERLARLDLQYQADLVVRTGHVVLVAGVVAGSRAARHATQSLRGETRPRYRFARLGDAADVRDHDVRRACVEHALDPRHVVDRNAHDGRGGRTANGEQLLSDDLQIVRRVLHVEQQPIEARVGDDLGNDVVGKVDPQADLAAAGRERFLEGIVRQGVHDVRVSLVRARRQSANGS